MSKRFLVFAAVVLLNAVFAQNVSAQSNLDLNGIGIKVGFVDPEGANNSVLGFGTLADFGTITPDIRLEGNLDYWSKSVSGVSYRDLILGGTAKYIFKGSNPKLRPFAGGGVAFHLFKFDGVGDAFDDSSIKLGVHLGGGLFYSLSPELDFIADGRYSIVSDASQIALQAGLVLKFTK